MSTTRVIVVDDHPVVRQGLCGLLGLHSDIEVVGEFSGGEDFLQTAGRLSPDVVLLDIRLAEVNGLELARQLVRSQPECRVIILTSFDDDAFLLEAAKIGVHGYLLKSTSPEVIVEAIRTVNAGGRWISSGLADKTMQHLKELSLVRARLQAGLSEEETDVLHLVAEGASTKDIAQRLYLSERTVKRRVRDILSSLGANTRAEAVAEAFRRNLL